MVKLYIFLINSGDCMMYDRLVEFLLRETPSHAQELKSDIGLLLSSLENTQSAVEGMLRKIDKYDYAKIGEYYSMADQLRSIREKVNELEQSMTTVDSAEQEDEEELQGVPNENKLNYSDYKVDNTVPHGLFENFTHKRPSGFVLEGNKYSARDWKQILRIVCEVLNQRDKKIFDSFVRDKNMQGNTRVYFAYTDDRMYNGRKISGSDVYVETNHNANGICSIIGNMLEKYEIPVTSIEIYLRSDYSPLHNDNENEKKK